MAHATPAEDPSSVPSSHIRQLTIACNANSKGFGTLFWLMWALAMQIVHINYAGKRTHVHVWVGMHTDTMTIYLSF